MAEPVWIRDDVVMAIHKRQLAEHGGAGGIRDEGLLRSALDRPRNRYAYSGGKADLATFAASYAHGITSNHPFIDGNKRTALVICRTFLRLNYADLDASQEQKHHTFFRLAAGEISEAQLANWIRTHLKPA